MGGEIRFDSPPLLGRASSPSEPLSDPVLLQMGEAAQMLNVSRATLWRKMRDLALLKPHELSEG